MALYNNLYVPSLTVLVKPLLDEVLLTANLSGNEIISDLIPRKLMP